MILKKSLLAFLLILMILAPQAGILMRADSLPIENAGISVEVFSIPKAHAQSAIGDSASKFFGATIEIFTVVNWLALAAVQSLLNPDVIFGAKNATTGVRPMEVLLNEIWKISRDIVNGVFAFLLLAFGVSMILFGAEKGVGAMIKEKAPKFVLAVILVNFSWFFPRVILDMANVMQAVIYQLPTMVARTGMATGTCVSERTPGIEDFLGDDPATALDESLDDGEKPCNFVWKVKLFPPTEKQCATDPAIRGCPRPTPTSTYPKRGQQIGPLVDIYYTDFVKVQRDGTFENGAAFPVSGADVVVNGLAVNFAKLPQLSRVEFDRARYVSGMSDGIMEKSQAYIKFFVYLAFHAIFSIAIGLILLAFAAVLCVRVAVIWLCVAFMPFIFVGFAWKGTLGDMGHEKAPNIWEKFIKYALLPVYVAVPLSIGFTLMSLSDVISAYSTLNTLTMEGVEDIITGINGFHELLWLLMTLGIIWTGTFSVLESDELSSKIVGGIKGFGEGTLNIAKRSAMYAPVIPFPGKGGGSTSVGNLMDSFRGASQQHGLPDLWRIHQERMRGPAEGTTAFAPTKDDVHAIADHPGIQPKEFKDLAKILKDTNGRDAQRDLDRFAAKLNEITRDKKDARGNSMEVTTAQAKAIVLHPERLNELAEKLTDKGIISPQDAADMRTKSELFVNVVHKGKVDIRDADDTRNALVQKTKLAIANRVPPEDLIKALKAHEKEHEERGNQVKVDRIKEILAAVENAAATGGNVDPALDAIAANPIQ